MNLHGIATGLVTAVNPLTPATLKTSTGYTTDDAGARTPAYSSASVQAQVQGLSGSDLQQVDGLNLQGVVRAMYLTGEADGVVRINSKGGDVVIISAGVHAGTWLVNQVLEQWPDWCKVIVTLQDD